MGMVGNFGSRIVFETSDRPEFTGPGSISLNFKIMLDVTLGVRPREVMDRIEEAVESGETGYLVIGGRPMSRNKFYISSVSEAYDVVMSHGEIARATLNISMEEYL